MFSLSQSLAISKLLVSHGTKRFYLLCFVANVAISNSIKYQFHEIMNSAQWTRKSTGLEVRS